MAKKIIREEHRITAIRKFTDREKARDAFWNNYSNLCQCMNQDNIKVLNFYGIGGIGKTSLCKKIVDEIEKCEHNPKYVFVDFEEVSESRKILYKMKCDLSNKYKFSFLLFEYALYMYEIKCGKDVNKPEMKAIISESPFLSMVSGIADAIPVVSSITSIVKAFDASSAYLRNAYNKHKEEFKTIEMKGLDELKEEISLYFTKDLVENLKNEEVPFIVIFDTYEKIVNEISAIGNPLKSDIWIRGDKGLILNIPNTLWVISGREHLKWKDIDLDWDETCLEKHLVGDLSKIDATEFLKTAGVEEDEIVEKIYEITQGVPFHLDLCVDTYYAAKGKGQQISTDLFQGDTIKLAERFLRYMGDNEKELLYLLTCMENWNDEEFIKIYKNLSFPVLMTTYEKIKSFSFVISEENKKKSGYYMHNSIQKALKKQCPSTLRNVYLDYLVEDIKQNIIDERFSNIHKGIVKVINNFAIGEIENIDNIIDIIENSMILFIEKYEFEFFMDVYRKINKIIKQYNMKNMKLKIQMLLAKFFIRRCEFANANSIYNNIIYENDITEEEIVQCYENMAYCYGKNCNDNKYEKAIMYANKAIEIRESNLEYYEYDLPIAYNSLAYVYFSIGLYDEAMELYKKSREIRIKHCGEEHHRTIANENNIAEIFIKKKQYEEAELLLEKCLGLLRKNKNEYFLYTLVCESNSILCKLINQKEKIEWNEIENLHNKIKFVLDNNNEYSVRMLLIKGEYWVINNNKKNALTYFKEAYEKSYSLFGGNNIKTVEVKTRLQEIS